MKSRPGFILYFDNIRPALKRLTDKQCGLLLRAAVEYAESGVIPDLEPIVGMAFEMLVPQIDRDAERYELQCEQRRYALYVRESKRHGAEYQPFDEWKVSSGIEPISTDIESYPTTTEKSTAISKAIATAKGNKRVPAPERGKYGWVKLTDEQYNKLVADLGEAEALRCIRYVDESAQATGNKNHWQDWNLVVRKCNRYQWGVENGQREHHANGKDSGGKQFNVRYDVG